MKGNQPAEYRIEQVAVHGFLLDKFVLEAHFPKALGFNPRAFFTRQLVAERRYADMCVT